MTFDLTVSRNEDDNGGMSEDRKDFKEIIKEILSRNHKFSPARFQAEKATDQTLNSKEKDSIPANNAATAYNQEAMEKVPTQHSSKTWKKRLGTLTSVDSTYCGFGVSKSTRNEFLSQIGIFQNLCPTDETSDDMSDETPAGKITHWQDDNVVIPISDGNVESQDENDCHMTSDLSELSCDESKNEIDKLADPDEFFNIERDTAGSGLEELTNSNNVSVHSTLDGTIRSSTYFDMFSSFDHSHLHDDVEPNNVAMLGDVISLRTNTGEQTIFRLAGAGLRYGTVGGTNSFQVEKITIN